MRPQFLRAVQHFTHFLSSRSDHSTYTPDKSLLFWSLEKPEYPQLEPHTKIKMALVLGSPVYIYGIISSWQWNHFYLAIVVCTCWHISCIPCENSRHNFHTASNKVGIISRGLLSSQFARIKFHWNCSIYCMTQYEKLIVTSGYYKNHCKIQFRDSLWKVRLWHHCQLEIVYSFVNIHLF